MEFMNINVVITNEVLKNEDYTVVDIMKFGEVTTSGNELKRMLLSEWFVLTKLQYLLERVKKKKNTGICYHFKYCLVLRFEMPLKFKVV